MMKLITAAGVPGLIDPASRCFQLRIMNKRIAHPAENQSRQSIFQTGSRGFVPRQSRAATHAS